MGHVRAFDPLLAGPVRHCPLPVAVLGVFAAHQVGDDGPSGMAVIADGRAGLQDDGPQAEGVSAELRNLRPHRQRTARADGHALRLLRLRVLRRRRRDGSNSQQRGREQPAAAD